MSETEPVANDEVLVREKASHRKGRTNEVRRAPRVPLQDRSKKRYQTIIEATQYLLQTANIEDISLYDVAARAELAPASVHYLFNTIAAIHIELNKIYNSMLTERVLEKSKEIVSSPKASWQDLVRGTLELGAKELNANRAMSEILLGPNLHRTSRTTNYNMNIELSNSLLSFMRGCFVVPEIPGLNRYFMYSTEIADSFYAGSYLAHGRVTEDCVEEAYRASVSYLRCFLPETLMRKNPINSEL